MKEKNMTSSFSPRSRSLSFACEAIAEVSWKNYTAMLEIETKTALLGRSNWFWLTSAFLYFAFISSTVLVLGWASLDAPSKSFSLSDLLSAKKTFKIRLMHSQWYSNLRRTNMFYLSFLFCLSRLKARRSQVHLSRCHLQKTSHI